MSERLVVLDANYPDTDVERDAAAPYDVIVERRSANRPSDIPAAVGDAAGLLVQYLPIDDSTMAACPNLRVIGRYGVGVDNIDINAASRRGISVINVPDYAVEEVASHAVALMLAAWRQLPAADRLVRTGRWGDWETLAPIGALSEATLGLLGAGRIGTEVIRQAGHLFGSVVVHDPACPPLPAGVAAVELEELLECSDIVSLHLPLNQSTKHIIDAARLARMKRTAVLVNVSRGGLIDTSALADALDRGRPRTAALDVLPDEPPAEDDPLLSHPATLLTNHVAWYSTRSTERLRRTLAGRCAASLVGQQASSVVNADALGAS